MSKIIDVRGSGGELVVLGRALVLPASDTNGTDVPLDGSIRFNPTLANVEVCFAGVWSLLSSGGGGGGSGSSGPFPISNVVGLQTALDNKAAKIHVHVISEVTGLQAVLDNKSNLDHGHSLTSIPNLQPTLDSLQAQINTKAPTTHTHVIANVSGLQTALDNKAPYTHTHEISSINGLSASLTAIRKEKIGMCLPGQAPSGFKFSWTSTEVITFAPNFAGSYGTVQSTPSANYIIGVSLNSATVGTVRVTAGATTATFTASNTVTVAAGQTLVFTCPTLDPGISTLSFTLVGQKS